MLVIGVLGELYLELDGERVEPPARRSGRLLLGYLAVHRGLHARGDLAAVIWPEVLDSSARASLRSAVAAARRALAPAADRYLVRTGDMVGLADDDVCVDIERFDRLVAGGDVEAALELSRGHLLQGLDAEWVRHARLEHLAREGELLATLAAAAERRGSLDEAIRLTRRRVALAPLAEPPNRELIRLLTAIGDRASALSVYAELADRFRRELQTVPSAQTRRLADEARSGAELASADSVSPPLPEPLAAALDEPFVDRVEELDRLSSLLGRACDGERQAVVVTGEPGIGKSSLVARFAAAAATRATVLLGRCRAASDPLVEALRHYVAHVPSEVLERELPPAAGELAALLPELRERLIAAPLPADLLEDGGRVGRAIVEVLLTVSRRRPLVVVVEDLHEAGADLGTLVAQLLGRSDAARLMIVLTARDTDVGAAPWLQRLLRDVRTLPGGGQLPLAGLDAAAVGELSRLRGDDLSAEQLGHLHARTRGNPFLASALLAAGAPAAGWPLPERIQDLVAEELARVGADAQACVGVASVLGLEFDLETVRRVSGHGEDRTLDALDEAVAAGLIRELPSAVGRYEFRHELLRDGIYAGLTATRRAHLHRRAAHALREAGAAGELSAVVEHLRQGRDLVPAAELAAALLAAAEEAEARGAHAEAAAAYAEAVDRLGDLPERRCRALVALGRARRRSGESDGASAAFLEAGELGRGEVLVAAALGLCETPFYAGDRPLEARVVALLERALEATGDLSERARLMARLAAERHYEREPSDRLAREAIALARRADEPRALAAALDVGHLTGSEGPEQRLALAGELIALARDPLRPEVLVPALVHETVARVELGDLDALERGASAMAELAAELRQPAYGWWADLWRCSDRVVRGELDEAEQLTRAAYEAGRAAFGPAADLELQAQLVWLALERQQLAALAAGLPALQAQFSTLPVLDALRTRVLVEVAPQRATDVSLAGLQRDPNWLVSAWLLAESATRTCDEDLAARLRAALEPRAGHWAISARGTVCLGPVAGALALVAHPEDEAERHLEAALEQCAAVGARTIAERIEREYRRREGREPAAAG